MVMDSFGNELGEPSSAVTQDQKPPRDRKSVFAAENVNATKAGKWSDQFKQQFDQEFGPGAFQSEFEAANQAVADAPRKAQEKLSQDFEANRPGMERNAFESATVGERQRLAGELSGIKSGASRKGLLYSGIRQGAEAGARAGSDVSLAQQKANINKSFDQTSDALKQAPIKTALSVADAQSSIANTAMSQALKNMEARNSSLSKFGQAAGTAVGEYLAQPAEKKNYFESGPGSGSSAGRYGSNLSQ